MSKLWFETHKEERRKYRQELWKQKTMNKETQIVIVKCNDCKTNDLEYNLNIRGSQNKKYCDDCLMKRKRINSVKRNVQAKTKRIYPKLRINLTKNYIIMMEGIK